jgi:hypothetical protein
MAGKQIINIRLFAAPNRFSRQHRKSEPERLPKCLMMAADRKEYNISKRLRLICSCTKSNRQKHEYTANKKRTPYLLDSGTG